MTNRRVTRLAVEALVTDPMPARRVTRTALEILSTDPAPARRVTRTALEALQIWVPPAPNLIAHYDASTLGLADGATVTTLDDLSGNGFHLSSVIGATTKPTYEANSLNGMGGVKFVNTQNIWGNVAFTTIKTFIYVMKSPPNDGKFRGLFSAPGGLGQITARREVPGELSWGTYDPHIFIADFSLLGTTHVFTYLQRDSGVAHVRVDGVRRSAFTSIPAGTGVSLYLGDWSDPWPGDRMTLYEMRIYDRQMTDAEMLAIETELHDKWLSVPPVLVPADWAPEPMLHTIEGLARHSPSLASPMWDDMVALTSEAPIRFKGEYGPDGAALTPDDWPLANALAIRAGKALTDKPVSPLVPFLAETQILADDPAVTNGGWTLTGNPSEVLESRATAAIIGQVGTSPNEPLGPPDPPEPEEPPPSAGSGVWIGGGYSYESTDVGATTHELDFSYLVELGWLPGDVILVCMGADGNSEGFSGPAGYTMIASYSVPGDEPRGLALWVKEVEEDEATTGTFSATDPNVVCFGCWRGITSDLATSMAEVTFGDPENPVVANPPAPSTGIDMPGLAVTGYFARDTAYGSPAPPSGYTLRALGGWDVFGGTEFDRAISYAFKDEVGGVFPRLLSPGNWTVPAGTWALFTLAFQYVPE